MKVLIDKAGRVVLPKVVRTRLQIHAGDHLQLDSEGDRIVLKPMRSQAPLRKEHGIWVYHGEASQASIPDLIDHTRGHRMKDFLSLNDGVL